MGEESVFPIHLCDGTQCESLFPAKYHFICITYFGINALLFDILHAIQRYQLIQYLCRTWTRATHTFRHIKNDRRRKEAQKSQTCLFTFAFGRFFMTSEAPFLLISSSSSPLRALIKMNFLTDLNGGSWLNKWIMRTKNKHNRIEWKDGTLHSLCVGSSFASLFIILRLAQQLILFY